MASPLDGVRVLDLTSVLSGPYCTRILGDMGADVIKVESPKGDITRRIGPKRHKNMAAVFLNCNRNKRSIVLDLKTDAGRAALLRIAAQCDVFVHNMRPQAIAKLGLSYEAVKEVNPRIVYAGIYGYRADGPLGNKPAYDDIIQGASGIASLQAHMSGEPTYVASDIADKITGIVASGAVIAALYHRERTGEGQFVEIPMFETMVSFSALEHLYGFVFEPPLGNAYYPRATSSHRKPYRTKDGYICPVIYLDKHWTKFFELSGCPELMTDPRFADIEARTQHIDQLYQIVEELLATRTTAEWLEIFEQADIPVSVLHTIEDLVNDPHLAHSEFFKVVRHPTEGWIRQTDVPVRFSKGDAGIRRLAPRLGEHSVEILTEFGFTPSEVAFLLENNITANGVSDDVDG